MTASVLPDLDLDADRDVQRLCETHEDDGWPCSHAAEWVVYFRCDNCGQRTSSLICAEHHSWFVVHHKPASCRHCRMTDVPYTCLSAERL